MSTPTINGKPVIADPTKRIINFASGFAEKMLCDGPTFSTGTACVYSCSYCYVGAMMARSPTALAVRERGHQFHDVVMRRTNPLVKIREALLDSKGRPKFTDAADRRVIYASPLVDVAPTMELVIETTEACRIILDLTNWQIRLLSKSPLLVQVARKLPESVRSRVIYGLSTGTLDNNLVRCFEQGTPLVSKRIEALHRLQDDGYRTFGMICPSLPQIDYADYSAAISAAIRVPYCEHVWAEVLNFRGESMSRTNAALTQGGYGAIAEALTRVAADRSSWEQYARSTFLAHASHVPPDKLRFLQYVTKESFEWWKGYAGRGAILLGKAAQDKGTSEPTDPIENPSGTT